MGAHELAWRKSTFSSGGGNGDCVEIAEENELVAVRDSKNPAAGILTFTPVAWAAFVKDCKTGTRTRY